MSKDTLLIINHIENLFEMIKTVGGDLKDHVADCKKDKGAMNSQLNELDTKVALINKTLNSQKQASKLVQIATLYKMQITLALIFVMAWLVPQALVNTANFVGSTYKVLFGG